MGLHRPTDVCPICGKTGKLTAEDVYPMWLRRSMAERHVPDGDLPPKVILHVCRSCNGRLGSVFEDTAAPILKRMLWQRPPQPLTEEEIHLVARWALKTDILLAIMPSRPRRASATAAVAELATMLTDSTYMPAGSLVRALYVDPDEAPTRGLLVPNLAVRGGIASFHPIGPLAFDTFVGSDPDDIERYAQALRSDERSTVLHPTGSTWPPARGISPHDLDVYRHQIGHSSAPTIGGGWIIEL